MKNAPHSIRAIMTINIITLILLLLALAGVVIPLFIVPPYPISDARLLAGTIAVPIVGGLLILNIFAIIGTLSRKPVGKFFQTLYSFLMLFVFPIGTVLHGYVLYELYSKEESEKYFVKQHR